MRALLLATVAFPLPALAAPYCEPPENLRAIVNYCDENPAYAAAARVCRDKFRELVREKNAEIQGVLDLDLRRREGDEQDKNFQTTQAVLASAEATLALLIAQGKASHNEIDVYAGDLVLPIYAAYEEDYSLDPWAESTQKIFREKNCYGEPAEDLDAVRKELRELIGDLERTKAKALSLHGLSNFREGNLGGRAGAAKTAGESGPQRKLAAVKKKKKAGQSGITGVETAQRKEMESRRVMAR